MYWVIRIVPSLTFKGQLSKIFLIPHFHKYLYNSWTLIIRHLFSVSPFLLSVLRVSLSFLKQPYRKLSLPVWWVKQEVTSFWTSSLCLASWETPSCISWPVPLFNLPFGGSAFCRFAFLQYPIYMYYTWEHFGWFSVNSITMLHQWTKLNFGSLM